jgi:hypothetical protein
LVDRLTSGKRAGLALLSLLPCGSCLPHSWAFLAIKIEGRGGNGRLAPHPAAHWFSLRTTACALYPTLYTAVTDENFKDNVIQYAWHLSRARGFAPAIDMAALPQGLRAAVSRRDAHGATGSSHQPQGITHLCDSSALLPPPSPIFSLATPPPPGVSFPPLVPVLVRMRSAD